MDKNNKMVINPRGAIKSKGKISILDIVKYIILINNINATILAANIKLVKSKTFFVSMINPNNKKNIVLTKKVNSITISLNRPTSLTNLSVLTLFKYLIDVILSMLFNNKPKIKININAGK